MLFHATITNIRKDAHSRFAICHRVFAPRGFTPAVLTQQLRSRSYSVKRHFRRTPVTWKGHNREPTPTPSWEDAATACSEGSNTSNLRVSTESHSDYRKSQPSLLTAVPPRPSTKWELHEEILRLLALTPPAPFSRLISLHQRHPALQSVESYNLLLHFSIRHSFSRHTRLLISSMAANQIEPNSTTEKLVVRHMVVVGNWAQAWRQVVRRYPAVADIPMIVLLELLAPGTRNFRQLKLRPLRRTPGFPHPPFRPPLLDLSLEKGKDAGSAFKIPLDTLILLFHRFRQLPLHEMARLHPRFVSYAVRGLIRNGHQEPALVLTERHLKSLPPVIAPKRIAFARDLVHLHLSTGELKLANYEKKRRLVEHLFSLHPSLHPDAKTVFLLMRYMERSKRCGIEAYLFFKDYRARWGPIVENLEVRRRIVKYALKQRKLGIAKEMAERGPLDDPLPQHQNGHIMPQERVRTWRSMYPRKGKGARLWKRLMIRLLKRRRMWKRRVFKIRQST